jgi:hypothetical protein
VWLIRVARVITREEFIGLRKIASHHHGSVTSACNAIMTQPRDPAIDRTIDPEHR